MKRTLYLLDIERRISMVAASFVQMLGFYAVEFVCIVAIAVAGVFVGKKIRDSKDKKKENIGE